MVVETLPKLVKKGEHAPHMTEKSMKDTSLELMNDIKMDTTGHLKHTDTKTKKLPKDLI